MCRYSPTLVMPWPLSGWRDSSLAFISAPGWLRFDRERLIVSTPRAARSDRYTTRLGVCGVHPILAPQSRTSVLAPITDRRPGPKIARNALFRPSEASDGCE